MRFPLAGPPPCRWSPSKNSPLLSTALECSVPIWTDGSPLRYYYSSNLVVYCHPYLGVSPSSADDSYSSHFPLSNRSQSERSSSRAGGTEPPYSDDMSHRIRQSTRAFDDNFPRSKLPESIPLLVDRTPEKTRRRYLWSLWWFPVGLRPRSCDSTGSRLLAW